MRSPPRFIEQKMSAEDIDIWNILRYFRDDDVSTKFANEGWLKIMYRIHKCNVANEGRRKCKYHISGGISPRTISRAEDIRIFYCWLPMKTT